MATSSSLRRNLRRLENRLRGKNKKKTAARKKKTAATKKKTARKTSGTKARCRAIVSRKMRKTHQEFPSHKQAVAVALNMTRKKHPECKRYIGPAPKRK